MNSTSNHEVNKTKKKFNELLILTLCSFTPLLFQKEVGVYIQLDHGAGIGYSKFASGGGEGGHGSIYRPVRS